MAFVERLESTTAEELFERKVHYHNKIVNKNDRARKRFAESINNGASYVFKRKKGHNLQEKRLTMTTNFIEQNQRLNNMTKLCV